MGILGMISNKLAEHKAAKVGISPSKFKKYEAARKKELYLAEMKAKREAQEKYIVEKEKLKYQQKLAHQKSRVSPMQRLQAGLKAVKKNMGENKKKDIFGFNAPKKDNPFTFGPSPIPGEKKDRPIIIIK